MSDSWHFADIFDAAREGTVTDVKYWVERQGADVNAKDNSGSTPLHCAAGGNSNVDVVKYLISRGADVNAKDNSGSTPLHCAGGENSNVDVVKYLISRGADVNARNSIAEYTPLHYACAHKPNLKILQCLISHGADINAKGNDGATPLDWATLGFYCSRDSQIEVLKYLIAKGADVNASDLNGRALINVIGDGDAAVTVLLEAGADVNAKSFDGYTALHFVRSVGEATILLDAGADVNTKSDNGTTALHYAAFSDNDNEAVVIVLLEAGADVNTKSDSGQTALHNAVSSNNVNIVTVLLEAGADVNARNNQGEIPLDIALRENQTKIADQLREAGVLAEINALVGLQSVKMEVNNFVAFLKIQRARQQHGLPTISNTLHYVFTGNPGTGKTTVARIFAKILYGYGFLQSDKLIETDRRELVAGYIGQTAIRTDKKIQSALDGVLFIDEAYSLTSEYEQDFGHEAISTLLKRMEDYRDRLVVIVAGYTEPMKKFLQSNSGLSSRFTRFLHFEDYSPAELMAIFQQHCEEGGYYMTESALRKIRMIFEEKFAQKDEHFGNARYVRNVFEQTTMRQSFRLSKFKTPTREQLTTIETEDIPE